MEITKTLYVVKRHEWRKWLKKYHQKEPDIWLIFPKKASGQPRLPYNDAVDEALCFGWIDSTVKKFEEDSTAQRFSPRRPKSELSQMNKERIWRLMDAGKMTEAGLDAVKHVFDPTEKPKDCVVPKDIKKELKKDKEVWENFRQFPESYKRIRIGFIDHSRSRPEEFKKRLAYFIKMTKKNKRYGMVQ